MSNPTQQPKIHQEKHFFKRSIKNWDIYAKSMVYDTAMSQLSAINLKLNLFEITWYYFFLGRKSNYFNWMWEDYVLEAITIKLFNMLRW